jgi:UDP-N-acetyl-D-mannosaminuronic acid dehydrogenase
VKNLNESITFINEDDSVSDLIFKFNDKKKTVALCLNKKKKVLGIVTIGDLRRSISKSNNFDLKISKIYNKSFFYVYEDTPFHEVNSKLFEFKNKNKKNKLNTIIILDKNHKFVDSFNEQQVYDDLKFKNVCIVGLGYVGLPLLAHIGSKKQHCIGYDKKIVIESLKKNKIKFYEKNLKPVIFNLTKNKKISFFSDLRKVKAEIYIICIGSYLNNGKLNNKIFFEVLDGLIKKNFKEYDLLIMRGTVNVGFSRFVGQYIQKKTKGKLIIGKNFFLSFFPERLIQGDALNELSKIPQIISGYTEECRNHTLKLCSKIFPNNIIAESLEEAEILKLASNAYRDLSFSFSNELFRICSKFNLDVRELISKANQGYQRNNIPIASPGVGGSCLIKDPILFKYINNSTDGYSLGHLSRKINNNALLLVFRRLDTIRKKYFLNKFKVLIVGLAFKGEPETSDLRGSMSIDLIKMLKKNNIKFNSFDEVLDKTKDIKYNKKYLNKISHYKNLSEYDIILFMNNNLGNASIIDQNLKPVANKKKFIFDCWNIFSPNKADSLGYKYISLGKIY